MIGIIALASVSIIQYRSLGQLSAKYEQLEAEYEEITAGERIPEAWERTIRNLLEFERIKQQVTPQLKKPKGEGVPAWHITTAIDSTEK